MHLPLSPMSERYLFLFLPLVADGGMTAKNREGKAFPPRAQRQRKVLSNVPVLGMVEGRARRSARRGGPASRAPFQEDPGIRGPLHPRRLRCTPSPYRRGYASVVRLAGRGASALSVHGLFRNGTRDAGGAFRGGRSSLSLAGAPQGERRSERAPSEGAEPFPTPLRTGRAIESPPLGGGRVLGNVPVLRRRCAGPGCRTSPSSSPR